MRVPILADMARPITRQIGEDGTSLRRWFERCLPNRDAVSGGTAPGLRRIVPRGRPDTLPPWLIGMAFDWRLRIGIEVPADPAATTAFVGWEMVRDAVIGPRHFADFVLASEDRRDERSPVAALLAAASEAGGGGAGTRDEAQLAKIAVALSLYENCYRGGVRRDDPLVPLGASPSVPALLALCPDAAADEIARLTAAARRGLAPLFPAASIELNPDFTAHGTPADGDLIIDGLLLDLKTVTRPKVQTEWLWQILGYVFLDEGKRGIERVGLYLSRHAWLGTWEVDGLLSSLAGEHVTEQQLRPEFLAALG